MENIIKKEISIKFSFFSLLFILMVVLFHSGLRYHYPIIEDLAAMANSYFFCVSSFFFYRSLKSKRDFYRSMKKRIMTLFVPYVLWNITYMVLNVGIKDIDVLSIIYGLTVNNYCSPSWYLLTLLIFFMGAIFLRKAFEKWYTTVIVLAVGLLLSYSGYIWFQVELAEIPIVGGYLIRMCEYIFPYLVGGVIGVWFDKKVETTYSRNFVNSIVFVGIFLLLFSKISPEIRWFLWVIFPVVLWNAVPEKMFRVFEGIRWVAEPAFFIAMLHCYFLMIITPLNEKFFDVSDKKEAFISVVLAILMCYAIYYALKMFMPSILNLYVGRRMKK